MTMNKKTPLFLLTVLPITLLAGCFSEKEAVLPDKEPIQMEKEQESAKKDYPPLSIAEVTTLFTDDRYLGDYKSELKKHGYVKPTKEILLEKSESRTKKGLVYEVEDGYAVIEYNDADQSVIATTGYESLAEIELQEKKTQAYLLETKMALTKDESEKKALKQKIDAQWEEISKTEATLVN